MKKKESMTGMNETTRRHVVLSGIAPIMFDRYPGDNSTKLTWNQKVYLDSEGILCLPISSIVSFLSSHNTNSAPKRLRPSKEFKKICNACLSFTQVIGNNGTDLIYFKRDGKPIKTGPVKGTDEIDTVSGLYLHRATARLEKGIPNPKERPVLPLPWELDFDFCIYQNREIKEQEIKNLFEEGGIAIGLGTFRGVYGKFVVKTWE